MKTMSPMKTAADPLQPLAQAAADPHQLAQCLLRCSASRTAMCGRRISGSLLGWRESIIHPCHGVSSLDTAPFSIFLALHLALHLALCLSLDSKFLTLNQMQSHQPQPFLNALPLSSFMPGD